MITIVVRQTLNGWVLTVDYGKTKGRNEFVYATVKDVVEAVEKHLKKA